MSPNSHVRGDGATPNAASKQDAHRDARFGINDNESVPPGTLGTVDGVSSIQAWVAWDNGRRLAFTDKDTYRIV